MQNFNGEESTLKSHAATGTLGRAAYKHLFEDIDSLKLVKQIKDTNLYSSMHDANVAIYTNKPGKNGIILSLFFHCLTGNGSSW